MKHSTPLSESLNYSLDSKPVNQSKWLSKCMKQHYLLLFLMFLSFGSMAQFAVTTNGGSGLAPTYTSLANAITALNGATITSPVIITCPTGTETSPAGGYSITAQGTAVNTITIQGNGAANSVITAPSPAGTAGALNDAIFKLVGADFVTIQGFGMFENAANTTTTAGSNNMVEWGVALLYAGTTNGAQNNTIQNNTIDLNRTYQNTFGIYSNSTHTATNISTSATATGANGGNHGMKVYGNTITDVNMGIVVVGPTAIADANTGIDIGGSSLSQGNTISNYGTTTTFSGYVNVSGTINAVLVRNSNGYNISYNSISSSNGALTAGTLRGIFIPTANNAPTATFTNSVTNNSISVRSAAATGVMEAINIQSGTAASGSTININNNDVHTTTHTVASSGAINLITLGSTVLTANMNNNTFTNLSVNTSGNVNFFTYAPTLASGGTFNLNGNSIVTAFAKTTAGGTVTVHTTNASSVNGSAVNIQNNNFSNISITGSVSFVGINNTDGASASSGPVKTITGNTFNNISATTGSTMNPMTVNFSGANSSVSNNTLSNINWPGSVYTVLSLGSSNQATLSVSGNVIFGNTSNASGTNRMISTAAPTINILKNKIYNNENAGGGIYGIEVSAGTATLIANNLIADIRGSSTNNSSGDLIRGLSLTSTTTSSNITVSYNTVFLNNANNTSAQHNTSCVFHTASATATTANLIMRNNILVNTTTGTGGTRVAFRRSASLHANFSSSSNNNDLYGSAIYNDAGGFTDNTLADYKTRMSPRESASISEVPTFISIVGSNANFLHIDPTVATGIESGGVSSIGVTDDYDAQPRFGETGYSGGGTAPDIGADEFTGTPLAVCTGTPAASTIQATASSICTGTGTSLSLNTVYTDLGITYQWSSGTTSGGPYLNTLGTSSTQVTGTLTSTTYFICVITCTNSGLSYTTAEKEIVVNPLPIVTVTPSVATFCSPGGTPVALNAGGASTYAWSPASGLSATTGASVTASPSSTTTYTVTGTDINGCVNSTTAGITVAPSVSISAVTATPSTVCTGGSSQLLVTASIAGSNTAAAMSYSSQTGQSFETITSPTVETTVTSGTLDDGYKTVNTSPSFAFNFNGTNYSTFAAGTNGYVTIGGASSSIPSNITTLTGLNIIHAFGRDGNFNVTNAGNVTHGPAAGGKYVFQYNNYSGGASGAESPTITLSYQIVLWGNTSSSPGRIDIIYGTSAGTPATSGTIGIRDIAGTFINGINGSTSSTAVAAAWPASGQMYSFERIVPTYAWTPATYLDFTNISNPLATAVTTTETYTVTATAGACSATGNVTVTVASGAAITDDPDAVTKCAGETATFNVTATGPGLVYQWRKDGIDINTGSNPSAGTATLSLSNVSAADIATYDVVVTASCGSPVTSAGAALTVNTALAGINASATTVCAGTSVTLTENGGNATAWSWSPGGATTQVITVTPTVSTTYIVTTTFNGCNATASQLITVNPVPAAVSITPTSATICSGVPVALTASGGNIIESQVFNASSGSINLSIPDNISTGASNSIAVSGIPGTATIDSVIVTFNMTHEFSADAEVNLVAPNGQIINLMADRGSTSALGFVNTRVSSVVSRPAFSSGSNPFTGTFRADATAQANLIGSPSVTTTTFSNLFSTSNGNWTIRAYDDANGDVGVLSNWSIKIAYTNNIPSNFTWSPATGLDVTTGPSVNASPTSTTTYTATSTINGCSSSNTVEVTVTPNAAVTSVTGSSPLCIGATTTYTANGVVLSGGTGSWSSDNEAVATVDNAGLVTAVSAGSANITYTITGGCGGTVSAFATVTVDPNANAGTITGASTICTATSTTFSSNGDAGGTWSSDNNAVATVNPTSGLVTAVAPGTANITYTVNSGCASPVAASASITVASGAAPVVSGTVNVCPLIGTGTPVVYTASSAGATSYNWIVPPTNVTIVSGQGTSTLTVLFLNGFAAQPNKQLRVTATSACGVSAQTIYYLLAQTASTPGPITGPNSACPFIGVGTATYSIAAVPATSSYVWTVPANASIVSGQGSTSITVSFNNSYATGAITVASVNDCGPSSVRSLTVTRNNPSTPGLISGPTNACPFITPSGAATYTVTAVPSVTSYNWTVPPGAIGLTGQGTNTISFTYPSGFTTGTVSVTASNGCGTSGVRTLTIGTLQPATPSVIDVIQLQPCPNRVYSYTIATMPANAQSVLWTAPVGATILTGQGTTSITVSYPGTAVNGNVTATGVNNCGTSVARVSAVKLPACPPEERSADLFTKSGNQAVESMNVNIFPNPTTTDFKLQVITAGKEEINVRILDIQGRYLKQITVMPYQTVNLGAELKAGSYLVEVKQGKTVKTTRVIKF
ncbi:MAG: Ig-like domain-containing protein [Ferruginibacter sp.]